MTCCHCAGLAEICTQLSGNRLSNNFASAIYNHRAPTHDAVTSEKLKIPKCGKSKKRKHYGHQKTCEKTRGKKTRPQEKEVAVF
jgi:hypothetical protein